MPRSLCLTRQCLGLVTRIECVIRPLAGGRGLWTLLCAAGLDGAQPSAIKALGPFHGALMAEGMLASIIQNLAVQGYGISGEAPLIWQLHLQAELRRMNGARSHPVGQYQFQPES